MPLSCSISLPSSVVILLFPLPLATHGVGAIGKNVSHDSYVQDKLSSSILIWVAWFFGFVFRSQMYTNVQFLMQVLKTKCYVLWILNV